MSRNSTMMQYFEWYLPSDSTLWEKIAREAKHLENIGVNSIWLPPAYKGSGLAVTDGKTTIKFHPWSIEEIVASEQSA